MFTPRKILIKPNVVPKDLTSCTNMFAHTFLEADCTDCPSTDQIELNKMKTLTVNEKSPDCDQQPYSPSSGGNNT